MISKTMRKHMRKDLGLDIRGLVMSGLQPSEKTFVANQKTLGSLSLLHYSACRKRRVRKGREKKRGGNGGGP